MQTFAIRFGSPELAQEFKTAFAAGQVEMEKLLSGADATEGKALVDGAADALEGLAVQPATATTSTVEGASGSGDKGAGERAEGEATA